MPSDRTGDRRPTERRPGREDRVRPCPARPGRGGRSHRPHSRIGVGPRRARRSSRAVRQDGSAELGARLASGSHDRRRGAWRRRRVRSLDGKGRPHPGRTALCDPGADGHNPRPPRPGRRHECPAPHRARTHRIGRLPGTSISTSSRSTASASASRTAATSGSTRHRSSTAHAPPIHLVVDACSRSTTQPWTCLPGCDRRDYKRSIIPPLWARSAFRTRLANSAFHLSIQDRMAKVEASPRFQATPLQSHCRSEGPFPAA